VITTGRFGAKRNSFWRIRPKGEYAEYLVTANRSVFFDKSADIIVVVAFGQYVTITASMWVPFVKHFLGYIFDAQNYCIAFPPCKS
jgi:hypothetical protein